ncbi:DUF928 domain-containing protein [Trichormus azollae]|uniref:DUF928 domain-containing protein n=1 Tax=Trichormus azollae TaxID=1164 RepID=UPI00325F824F
MMQKKVIYKTILTLPKQPGIIRFTLHENVPELRINTNNKWYLFSVLIKKTLATVLPYVESFVKQIPANLFIIVRVFSQSRVTP